MISIVSRTIHCDVILVRVFGIVTSLLHFRKISHLLLESERLFFWQDSYCYSYRSWRGQPFPVLWRPVCCTSASYRMAADSRVKALSTVIPLLMICWHRRFRRFSQYEVARSSRPASQHTQVEYEYPTKKRSLAKTKQMKKKQYTTTVCVLTNGVFRWKVNSVCVEKLQEGPVDRVRELADLDHLLLVLCPLGAKHGPEMFTPTPNKRPLSIRCVGHGSELTVKQGHQ